MLGMQAGWDDNVSGPEHVQDNFWVLVAPGGMGLAQDTLLGEDILDTLGKYFSKEIDVCGILLLLLMQKLSYSKQW